MSDNSDNAVSGERDYDYSTEDVELEIDKLVNDVRAELPLEFSQCLDKRKRCKCRRYITDLNAHPRPLDGPGGYCRLKQLEGQEWAESICRERDAWVEVKRIVLNQKHDEIANRELRVELDWHQDQLRHIESTNKDALEKAHTNITVLAGCIEKLTNEVQRFINSPRPFSSIDINELVSMTNEVVDRTNETLSNDRNTDRVNDTENDDNGGWDTDWDETDGDDADDILPGLVTDYGEDDDEENEAGNELEQGGGTNVNSVNAAGDTGNDTGAEAGASAAVGSTVNASESNQTDVKTGLVDTKTLPKITVPLSSHNTSCATAGRHRVVDANGILRHTGLLTPTSLPSVNYTQGCPRVSFSDEQNADPNPNPDPDPALTLSGPLKEPPPGYQFPGLLEPKLPLYHQTGGTLCGGEPNLTEAKYLAKVISVSPNNQDNAEKWIEKWSALLLTLKVHGGSCSLYTILTIWVKQTPTLQKYYTELLERQKYFRSFLHFIEEFTKLMYPN